MSAEWFAGRLKELREQIGMSQKTLAERAGLNVRQVSRLETGAQTATWPVVVALCEALGVGPDAFLQKPAAMPAPERGRPRKAAPPEPAPKPARKAKEK